ncbi:MULTISPECIES: phosphohistidine phosphatase SixA [Desulfosediminicola]|uniref:phosphohistidine phosphatase SixA n=1 Tax=Desulfosediminicola TaxID=2886823 RepID=UPI0010ABFD6E|nr:phosphohistidine phosphatase SixA [Desulfosediminicola ganghwensis]
MAIYLVQHGLALSQEEDPQRGLAQEGIEKVRLIADVAANYSVKVDTIFHSGKARAEQTARLMAAALEPSGGIVARAGLAPMDDVATLAMELDPASNIMLVGHLPFMERLTSLLTTGSAAFRVFKFQNGGIVCLDRDAENEKWYVKWALMPNVG